MAARRTADADPSTRRRILAATFVVLARDGRRKLQLSDVAAEAKVSRPTLYRYFGSKEGLLEAFGLIRAGQLRRRYRRGDDRPRRTRSS